MVTISNPTSPSLRQIRLVPLQLMGINEETAKELACRLEDEAQEGAAE
jgi:hypothetical protein